jgi:hypothetical protein
MGRPSSGGIPRQGTRRDSRFDPCIHMHLLWVPTLKSGFIGHGDSDKTDSFTPPRLSPGNAPVRISRTHKRNWTRLRIRCQPGERWSSPPPRRSGRDTHAPNHLNAEETFVPRRTLLPDVIPYKRGEPLPSGPMIPVIRAQGCYYLIGGLWPLIRYRSFEAVVGTKPDRFQTEVTSVLFVAIGSALLAGTRRRDLSAPIRVLSVVSALGTAGVDLCHRHKLRWIFRGEAALELTFAATALRRDTGGLQRVP